MLEASQFESLVGAVEYACTDMESSKSAYCHNFLMALAKTPSFGKDMFLRIAGQLNDPLHQQIRPSLLLTLGDRGVGEKAVRDAIRHVVEVAPREAELFFAYMALKANDLAIERCVEAVSNAKFPPDKRVAIIAQLLASPSSDAAVAAIMSLRNIVGDDHVYSSRPPGRVSTELLKPLSDAAMNDRMSFTALLQLASGLLPVVVGRADRGEVSKFVVALLRRPEFTPLLHAAALGALCRKWIEQQSDEICVLVEESNRDPSLSLALCGVVTQVLADRPSAREWLLEVFVRSDPNEAKGMNLTWTMLGQALELYPDVVDRVVAKLGPSKAVEVQKGMDARGLSHIRGLRMSSLVPQELAGTGTISIFSCLGLMPFVTGGSSESWTQTVTIGAVVAIVLHFGVVLLITEFGQGTVLTSSVTKRLILAALAIGAAGALLVFREPILAAFVLAVAGLLSIVTTRVPIPSITNLAFLAESSCATGVAAVPLIWTLKGYMLAMVSVVVVTVAWRLVRVLAAPFYIFVSASIAGGPVRAGVFFAIMMSLSNNWHNSLSDIMAATTISCFAVTFPIAIYLQVRNRDLRGSLGWLSLALISLTTALTVALLGYLSLWLWAVVVLALGAFLLLPSPNLLAWVDSRVGPVADVLIGSTLAGLVIWWRWEQNDGLPMLFAIVCLWTSLCAGPTILGIVATVVAYRNRKGLRETLLQAKSLEERPA